MTTTHLCRILLMAIATGLLPANAWSAPKFVDRAPQLEIVHQYIGGWEHFVGGGVAVFDCNNDGFPEVFAAGGTAPSSLLINRTERAGGPLKFTPAQSSKLALTGVTGAYPIDIDSDGTIDLAIMRVGSNKLYRGLGSCRFETADEKWAFDGRDRWTTAFTAMWETDRLFPTLVFGNYVDRDNPKGPFGACDANTFYRADTDRYSSPALLSPGYCALSALFSDWGRNGRQDLRISNDRHYYVHDGKEQLWRFDKMPRQYTEAEGWKPLSIWGMGIASRDISGDGLPEVYLTSMGDQKLQLLSSDGKSPTYEESPYQRGITAHIPYVGDEGRPSSGWHAAFGDVDNDGKDDLFVAKGNVDQMPDAAMRDPNNLLMQQPDGSFREFGDKAGLATTERARGAAVVDLNRDGLLDIVVNNRRAGLELNENRTMSSGHWLAVELLQNGTNRNAVGSWIEVTDGTRSWHREVTIGGGHAGGSLGVHHFGTGKARGLRVRVIWPEGETSDWQAVEAGQHIRLERLGNTMKLVRQTE